VAIAVSGDRKKGGMVELNCETDFVARTEKYQEFAQALAAQVMETGEGDVEKVKAAKAKADPATRSPRRSPRRSRRSARTSCSRASPR